MNIYLDCPLCGWGDSITILVQRDLSTDLMGQDCACDLGDEDIDNLEAEAIKAAVDFEPEPVLDRDR